MILGIHETKSYLHVKDISNNMTTVLLISSRGIFLRAKHIENAFEQLFPLGTTSGLQVI
jgi:hypothetical protein